MKVWLLEFTWNPGYDEIVDTVGIFSSEEKANNGCPYKDELKAVGEPYGPEMMVDHNGDYWRVYPVELNAPIRATFPTWEDD